MPPLVVKAAVPDAVTGLDVPLALDGEPVVELPVVGVPPVAPAVVLAPIPSVAVVPVVAAPVPESSGSLQPPPARPSTKISAPPERAVAAR